MKFVCPLPSSWAKIYSALRQHWEHGGRVGPQPPVPLILNGWVFTNDLEKAHRWQETVLWARDRSVEHVVEGLREEDKFYVKEFASHTVGPLGGPLYLPWSFEAKSVPGADNIRTAMALLSREWSTIVGSELAKITKPLRFTGKKKRRLLVKADAEQMPPWGGWTYLAPGEKRRAFTRLRSAINRAISPLEVDHIDFQSTIGYTGLDETDAGPGDDIERRQ